MAKKPSNLGRTLRRAAWPAAGLVMVVFFGGYAIFGANGLLAYGDYQRTLAKRERDYQALDQRRAVLTNRVALLDPDHANPDLVDQEARKQLNVVRPDEVILLRKEAAGPARE